MLSPTWARVVLSSLLLAFLIAVPAAFAHAPVAALDGMVARAYERDIAGRATASMKRDSARVRRAPGGRRESRGAGRGAQNGSRSGARDPRLAEQWPLQGDRPMGIESAWRQTTGGEVIVAVVDTGIDLEHPDLAQNLWVNRGEIPGNGVDDDRNGYVDDVHGYDFISDDGDPADENGHGTHVAGIIAARGGNRIGVAGVAWRARLMALRVLDRQARGNTENVARAIRYAVDHGARVINLSLAGRNGSPELQDAIAYAEARDVVVVVAAGNSGANLARSPTYPAAYPNWNVIGVAATTDRGRLSRISDYGPGADLAAPGEDILSTAADGGYEWRSGTSMAAPHVAGTLVLLAAARPDLRGRALRDALLGGARWGRLQVEVGSLDAAGALRRVIPAERWKKATAASSTRTRPAKSKATKATGARGAKGKGASGTRGKRTAAGRGRR